MEVHQFQKNQFTEQKQDVNGIIPPPSKTDYTAIGICCVTFYLTFVTIFIINGISQYYINKYKTDKKIAFEKKSMYALGGKLDKISKEIKKCLSLQ